MYITEKYNYCINTHELYKPRDNTEPCFEETNQASLQFTALDLLILNKYDTQKITYIRNTKIYLHFQYVYMIMNV